MRILIIEDDPLLQAFMSEALSDYGSTDVASSGQEGVELFAKRLVGDEPFELIFVDLMLPEMDGHQALCRIHELEEEYQIPEDKAALVFITSALEDMQNLSRAFFQGKAVSYLTKPVDLDVLDGELAKFGIEKQN